MTIADINLLLNSPAVVSSEVWASVLSYCERHLRRYVESFGVEWTAFLHGEMQRISLGALDYRGYLRVARTGSLVRLNRRERVVTYAFLYARWRTELTA